MGEPVVLGVGMTAARGAVVELEVVLAATLVGAVVDAASRETFFGAMVLVS